MKLSRLVLAFGLASLCWTPASANLVVKDGNGNFQTLCTVVTGGVNYYCQVLFGLNGATPIAQVMDIDGSAHVNVTNLPIDGNGYLESGVYDAVHGVAVDLTSGTPGNPAGGVVSVQSPGSIVTNSSSDAGNTNAVATLPAVSGKTTSIRGALCAAMGSTTATVVDVTITGVVGGAMTFPFLFPTGAAVSAAPFNITFPQGVPAGASNTTIVVTLPAGGTGNLHASCSAWGFQQ